MSRAVSVLRHALLVALLCGGPVVLVSAGTVHTYSNSEHGYRLTYPASWHISVAPGKGGPTLSNYDLARAPGHGVLPPDAAEIFLLPHSDLGNIDHSSNPREWASADARRFAFGATTMEPIPNLGNPDISDVLRVAFEYKQNGYDVQQKYVTFYFRLNADLLKIELNYWEGDPKAGSYERTLISILKSIRRVTAKPN